MFAQPWELQESTEDPRRIFKKKIMHMYLLWPARPSLDRCNNLKDRYQRTYHFAYTYNPFYRMRTRTAQVTLGNPFQIEPEVLKKVVV